MARTGKRLCQMMKRIDSTARRYVLVGIFATILVSLTGCLPSALDFTTPAAWSGGTREIGDESERITAAIQLLDDRRAILKDFPQGTSRVTEDGLVCLDVSTSERYSGDATWSNRNGFSMALTFGDSTVVVSSDASFGDQDWLEARMRECTSDALWTLNKN
jgi:hypothetical protein